MSGRSDFHFARATTDDEPEIRALVQGLAMPGAVSVCFAREPDYFLGTTVQGDPCHVLVARHQPDGELAGVMVRGERRLYLGGEATDVAYIGQIRIAARFQGRWLMQRAVLEMAELRDRTALYFGVMSSDNPVAQGAIVGERPPGAPRITRAARLRSLAFVLHDHMRSGPASLPLTRADPGQLDELASFLRTHGPRRQLFPVIERHHLEASHAYRGLHPEDLSIVRRDGDIVGVLGSWDQSGFKQELVAGFSPRLRRLRPGYDLLARVLGGTRLPGVGEPVRTTFGCLHCQADDDPDVLAALLAGARARALEQGAAFLMVGFDERDPLLRSSGRRLAVSYRSDVILGSFDGGDPAAALDERPVRVELGTL